MSLLNRPSAGLHNVLITLYRGVLAHGPLTRGRLLALCGPPGACKTKKMLRMTLTTWKNLGLFEVRRDGKTRDDDSVRLAPNLPPAASDPVAGPDRLPDTLRELVFRPQNNANFWGRDDGADAEVEKADDADTDDAENAVETDTPVGIRSADFTRAACWCLALRSRLPVEQTLKAMWDRVDILQQQTLDKEKHKAFGNDTRWFGFGAWVPFLGFGWSAVSQALVMDPTAAVRRELPAVFKDEERLTQREFLDNLADRLPVLDGGDYRIQVEGKLLPGKWEPPPAGGLSESLSLALERLALAGTLNLEDLADADRATLIGPRGRPIRTFSHVVLRRARP